MAAPDWIVVCPVIAPRAETAAARATWDVDSVDLLVVDNTPDGAYKEGPWRYHRADDGRNLGVAASWNVGLDAAADLTIIMSSYLVLDEGLAKAVERMRDAANEHGCLTWQACHLWAITRKTVDATGTFDERYRIAYQEDTDYVARLELSGCHSAENPMPKIAIPGICPQARTLALGLAEPPMTANRERIIAKWGGEYPNFTYKHPWNDPSIDIRDWDRDG